MPIPTEGTIQAAEKIAQLIEKAPAGGIFHDARIPTVAGIEVPGYAGFAGFTIELPAGARYEVVVQRTR
jgi:hypothetical protein